MPPLIPPTYHPYLANTAALVACVPTAVGIIGLRNPSAILGIFESAPLSTTATAQDHKLLDGFIRLFAARDIAVGVTTLAIWYHGCRGGKREGYATLGTAMLAGAGLVLMDGLVKSVGEWTGGVEALGVCAGEFGDRGGVVGVHLRALGFIGFVLVKKTPSNNHLRG